MIEQYQDNTINVLSLKERQIGYEKMFDKSQARKLIRTSFMELLTDKEYQNENLALDILGILALRGTRLSINAIMEMLVEKTNIESSIKEVLDTCLQLNQDELIDAELEEDRSRLYFESKYVLNDEELELLDQYQYKIPMLVKPLPLNQKNDNRGTGYYLYGSKSLIRNVYHTDDIDHKVLERLNNIPYSINLSLMKNIRNTWKNNSKSKNRKQAKMKEEAFNFFEKGVFNVSSILIKNGNKFYFTHSYDKRGRIYCGGYHVQTQGNNYAKAQLEFANKQIISDDIKFF